MSSMIFPVADCCTKEIISFNSWPRCCTLAISSEVLRILARALGSFWTPLKMRVGVAFLSNRHCYESSNRAKWSHPTKRRLEWTKCLHYDIIDPFGLESLLCVCNGLRSLINGVLQHFKRTSNHLKLLVIVF